MCCGKNRRQVRVETPAFRSPRTIPNTGSNPLFHSNVLTRAVGSATPSSPQLQAAVWFVYGGKTGMTVVGPVSGRIYRFERPGARVNVDPRDRFLLASIPQLMLVK